jgi:hypothetical protein
VDILCPPFTPDSVRKALTKVPPWSESLSDSQVLEPVSAPKIIVPITIRDPPAKPSLTLASLPSASTSYQTQPTSASSHMSTLPSLAPLIPPPPHLAARASYSCPHVYAPALPLCARRRSVDVGGLALAMSGTAGQGGGWGGWAGAEEELALGVPSRKSKVKADTPAPKRRNNAGDDEVMYVPHDQSLLLLITLQVRRTTVSDVYSNRCGCRRCYFRHVSIPTVSISYL